MLSNDIRESALFKELDGLLASMDIKVVDAVRNDLPSGTQMLLTIFAQDREVNTDDLAKVYNIVYPRYQLLLGERDLSLEVSSPGLQRNFKDFYEFELFKGKVVRVYSTTYSSWVEGVIEKVEDSTVYLLDTEIADTGVKNESMKLAFNEIQKAKLTYRWEEKDGKSK